MPLDALSTHNYSFILGYAIPCQYKLVPTVLYYYQWKDTPDLVHNWYTMGIQRAFNDKMYRKWRNVFE